MQCRTKHLVVLFLASTAGLLACKRDTTGTTSTTSGEPAENGNPKAPAANTPPGNPAPGEARGQPEQARPGPADQGASSHQSEVSKLTSARCDHEKKCNHIGQGQGRKFATEDACKNELQAQGLGESYKRQCPASIDSGRLKACVSAIDNAACTNGTEPLTRFNACSVESLCPPTNKP
jgi:hypothetical protein